MKGQLGLPRGNILGNPFGRERKRKPVRTSDRKVLLKLQNGKCWKCKKSFAKMKVRKILHHKNLNPKDNRVVNMVLVCPNCHDKIHQKEKKVRKKVRGSFGLPEYKVVKVKKRKKTKKKRKKRRQKPRSPFDIKIPEFRI